MVYFYPRLPISLHPPAITSLSREAGCSTRHRARVIGVYTENALFCPENYHLSHPAPSCHCCCCWGGRSIALSFLRHWRYRILRPKRHWQSKIRCSGRLYPSIPPTYSHAIRAAHTHPSHPFLLLHQSRRQARRPCKKSTRELVLGIPNLPQTQTPTVSQTVSYPKPLITRKTHTTPDT